MVLRLALILALLLPTPDEPIRARFPSLLFRCGQAGHQLRGIACVRESQKLSRGAAHRSRVRVRVRVRVRQVVESTVPYSTPRLAGHTGLLMSMSASSCMTYSTPAGTWLGLGLA